MELKLSASVVTYNSGDEIRGVLNSLLASKSDYMLDIFVVDNMSTDNTVEIIEKEYPTVKLIKCDKNLGYGAGHNQAIRKCESDIHFIVNPDITFENDLINNAAHYFEKDLETVLAIPAVYGRDGVRKYPPKKNPRIRYIIPRLLKSKNKLFEKWRDEYTERKNVSITPYEIEFCAGSFMICRTATLKEVGGFDERFFLYYEDADLSRMMYQKGKVKCLPQYKVVHKGVRAAHHSSTARKYMIQSAIKYFNKWGWKF